MADTDVLTRPSPEATRDKDEVAHIVSDENWEKGYIMGEEIEALCGFRWIPSQDPEKYPVCQPCVEIFNNLEA